MMHCGPEAIETMPFLVKLTLTGAEDVQKALSEFSQEIAGARYMKNVMWNIGRMLQKEVRKRAPVDTGHLRDSINVREPALTSQGLEISVGSELVKYGAFQELGTGLLTDPPRKRHWPPGAALQGWAIRHGFKSGYVVAAIIGRRGGLRPRHFIRDSVREDWVVRDFNVGVRTMILRLGLNKR